MTEKMLMVEGYDRTTLKFLLEQDITEENKAAIRAELQKRGPHLTHHCPGCEAAARERDDLRAHPIICGCGDHIGYAEVIGLSQDGAVCGNCAVGRKDYDARTEMATMRAAITAKAERYDNMDFVSRSDDVIRNVESKFRQFATELRDLLAETEAK